MMSKEQRVRGSKYAAGFKRQLVGESRAAGTTVPMVSARHGVPASRIYSWRSDPRFQPSAPETTAFTPVEIFAGDAPELPKDAILSSARIEITLENGRKLSVSDGADAGFVLELARGLAA
ncbi:transposase [Tateyamaria pelophila]|uniref:transposase n=1 Tax=Tateyamaria pelophila TaxID=328415 RepID=UPI001CC037A9|nr:transposase [Tateyamaria pelophila]